MAAQEKRPLYDYNHLFRGAKPAPPRPDPSEIWLHLARVKADQPWEHSKSRSVYTASIRGVLQSVYLYRSQAGTVKLRATSYGSSDLTVFYLFGRDLVYRWPTIYEYRDWYFDNERILVAFEKSENWEQSLRNLGLWDTQNGVNANRQKTVNVP